MRHKFYIFLLNEDSHGLQNLLMYPVYTSAGGWLEFDTYNSAELWIQDQRADGDERFYQIQKVYV